MKKLVMGVVAVGVLMLGAPVASAAETYEGGCGFDSATSGAVSADGEYSGTIYAVVAAADDATGAALAIDATCWIQIDGSADRPDTEVKATGTGVAANAKDITFIAPANAVIELCFEINYGGSTDSGCDESDSFEFPPPAVEALLNDIFALTGLLDSTLCPVLITVGAALNGGVDGVLEIDTQGDVYVADELFWDCPPYEV